MCSASIPIWVRGTQWQFRVYLAGATAPEVSVEVGLAEVIGPTLLQQDATPVLDEWIVDLTLPVGVALGQPVRLIFRENNGKQWLKDIYSVAVDVANPIQYDEDQLHSQLAEDEGNRTATVRVTKVS